MSNMETYIQNFHSFKDCWIYDFKLGEGGIGDYIKYFTIILTYCMKNNIQAYIVKNNLYIEQLIELKYKFMYIEHSQISNLNNYVIKKSCEYFNRVLINYPHNLEIEGGEIFEFTKKVKDNVNTILKFPITNNYISIHLRLGDKYLETDKKYIICKTDNRGFSEEKLFKFIEDNYKKNILFFCDNNTYKSKIKGKYNKIILTTSDIGHTALFNTTNKQSLDAVTDFYILSQSDQIVAASSSGFSVVAAKFKNTKFIS